MYLNIKSVHFNINKYELLKIIRFLLNIKKHFIQCIYLFIKMHVLIVFMNVNAAHTQDCQQGIYLLSCNKLLNITLDFMKSIYVKH